MGSLGLSVVSFPVVQDVSVEEESVNGKIVVSFCLVVAVGASEVGLSLEIPARVAGSVFVSFDVVVAAVLLVLLDVIVVAAVVVVLLDVVAAAAVFVVLFDVVVPAVVVVLTDMLVAAAVVVWLDVLFAAVVGLLLLLEVLEDALLPLVVLLIVGTATGNVAGLTTVTAVGEVA